MTFFFSSCRRTRLASKPQVTLSTNTVHYIEAPPTDPVYQHFDRPYFAPFSLPGGLQRVHDSQTDQSAPRFPILSSVGTLPVSSQGNASSNTHSTSSHDIFSRCHRYAIQEVKFEALVQLVDSGLRRMMSDCKPVKQAGIILSSDIGFPKLATISPTLFSPGYAKVRPILGFHDSTNGLLPGDFAAFKATSHDSTSCVWRARPHEIQPLET